MHNQKLELRHLRSFVAVSQELHFSRAAEQLHIAQPALSQQILQLEHILGTRLFERNHHSVQLTQAGQLFLRDALQILEQVNQSVVRMQQARKGRIGHLDIGFINAEITTANVIPDILASYGQRFPAVKVQLKEMYLQEQLRALKNQQIQAGFAAIFQDLPEEFHTEVLQRIPFVAVCSSQHHFALQKSVALASLIKEPFFFCPRQSDSGVLYDRITQLCGVNPRVVQEVSTMPILLGLIRANLGVSLVAASAMMLRIPGVVYLPLSDAHHDIALKTALIWNREEHSPLLQRFLAVAREVFDQQQKMLFNFEEWETSEEEGEEHLVE